MMKTDALGAPRGEFDFICWTCFLGVFVPWWFIKGFICL